ncbi:MAG TPA: sialidase family protein, partial [Acidimicrobiales bacterium]
ISSDGGKTWSNSTLPIDGCAPGTPPLLSFYQRASDPWVSFGPDGTAYASALAFDNVDNKNAVAAATSTDGGATWNVLPIPGSVFTLTSQSTDKNATTADPTRAGTAYTVWDTLVLATDNPDDNPHTQAYTGPAYFSRTTNGGQTWSQAKIIVNTANRQQTIGNIIVVDPRNGTLFDFTNLIVSPNTPFQGAFSNSELAFVKSTDGGDNWTAPQIIAPFNSLGVIDPNTGQRLRVGDGLEEVAIDPTSGKLYIVWESSTNFDKNINQSRGAWDNEILLTTSSDSGRSWTEPTVVHKLASGLPTYTPTVAFNGGTVAVTYYDNRNLAPGQTANLPTDYWVSYSTDGGVTFGNEHHITGPFDQLTAPFARGFFLGDYEGLQPSGNGFLAVFVKTNCDATDAAGQVFPTGGPCAPANSTATATSNTNPTDVFAVTLTP